MATNNKQKTIITHKVTLSQAGVNATFRLTDKEYNGLKKSCVPTMPDRLYNFSAYAWADYEISRAKCNRFHKLFNYHKGDFFILFEE